MVARSRGKGEDLPNAPELLRMLGETRRALIKGQGSVRPMGTTYHAISMVTAAIDALALFLTGNPIHFHDTPHGRH